MSNVDRKNKYEIQDDPFIDCMGKINYRIKDRK